MSHFSHPWADFGTLEITMAHLNQPYQQPILGALGPMGPTQQNKPSEKMGSWGS